MKKTLTIALAMLLVAAVSIAGTLAYLTSTSAEVKNTFTVGNVAITLDEKDVNNSSEDAERVIANEYHLLPGAQYMKDPTVHVAASSEDCYVFVKVVNGLGTAEAPAEGIGTIAQQMLKSGWIEIAAKPGYFYYGNDQGAQRVVDGGDFPVFQAFAIKGELSDSAYDDLKNAEITIKAFAIQYQGLTLEEAIAQFPEGF